MSKVILLTIYLINWHFFQGMGYLPFGYKDILCCSADASCMQPTWTGIPFFLSFVIMRDL